MKPTRPTPIISAAAVAAVRFGLRIAFSRASAPVDAPQPRQRASRCTRLSGSDDRAPEHGDAEEHQQRAEPDDGQARGPTARRGR